MYVSLSLSLSLSRLTEIVDIGANPIDGDPPYKPMLEAGLCRVTGFEPQPQALEILRKRKGKHETYLPYALGDGKEHTLHCCEASGMTSMLEPDLSTHDVFESFKLWGKEKSRVRIPTRRLDDVSEIVAMDMLKIDVQGYEREVFANGLEKLAQCVVVHTEVSFVPLYRDMPTIGDVDSFLRRCGFIPHTFQDIKKWIIAPCVIGGNPRKPLNQLLEADMVYVRDFRHPEAMTDGQLKHLALISHCVYGSYDLTIRCLSLLEKRGVNGLVARYLQSLHEAGASGKRA